MYNISYWSTKWPFYNDAEKQPDSTSDDYDKIYKIRPLFNLVVKAFQSVYVLNHELSTNKSIIGYKGRLSWIQYTVFPHINA